MQVRDEALDVIDFPLLFLIVAMSLQGRQLEPDLTGYGVCVLLLSAVVVVSWVSYVLFERRSDAVREWAKRKLVFSLQKGWANDRGK